ncbi:glycosyltransferase [Akkermansiaceae bacterium]|nr:glycosyltransferase [Akkermansiaceae bacterium]
MAKNYRVTVVTRRSRRAAIDRFLGENPVTDLNFEYVDFADWVLRFKKGSLAMNLYYLCWQVLAFFKAKKLVKEHQFKLAHHVSFMSLTRGSFVPFLGIPSILGPIGGLQTAPPAAKRIIKNPFTERIRDFGVQFFRWNLIGNLTSSKADLIVLANGANVDCLPEEAREKSMVGLQIGTGLAPARPIPPIDGEIVFRWVGRLVDHKGLEILLDVLDSLRASRPDLFRGIKVVVSGNGPLKGYYHELIKQKDLNGAIEFVEWLSDEEMDALWSRCHAFLFTSLRETTGLALMEAMVRGVPPIVIDSGGPAEIVTDDCGIKISGETYDELTMNYRDALIRSIEEPSCLAPLGEAARERVLQYYTWDAVGAQMGKLYRKLLNPSK